MQITSTDRRIARQGIGTTVKSGPPSALGFSFQGSIGRREGCQAHLLCSPTNERYRNMAAPWSSSLHESTNFNDRKEGSPMR